MNILSPVITSAFLIISPLFGFSKPAISRNKVLFPHPEGPNIEILSPIEIFKLRSFIVKSDLP